MKWIIVGLGNPGEEYSDTRHNAGWMAVEHFAKKHDAGEWKEDKKAMAMVAKGEIGKHTAVYVLPTTYMNKSGAAVSKYILGPKMAKNLILLHDDMDLPLGRIKVSFGKNSGGHRGIESVMKAIKSKEFTRIRIGVSPENAKGVAKKPTGEEAVLKFIVGKFKPAELIEMKAIFKKTDEALATIVEEGYVAAMNACN
jgi:PTH1 family peptidyl-tRNA hydrolase